MDKPAPDDPILARLRPEFEALLVTISEDAARLELIHDGLPFDGEIAKFLQDGFETKQGVDYGDGRWFVDRATAESYLARAQAFLAEARRVCT